jgi:hypothetical protein
MLGMIYLKVDDFAEFENLSKLANLPIGVSVFVPPVKIITQFLTWA